LIGFRALQGVGGAAMAALTLSILVDVFPEDRRTGAIGTWAAVGGLGFGLGPVIGGVLIQLFDWSAVFWVNVPIAAVCGAFTVVGVRESRDPAARPLDPVGALLAATALFLLTFALIESNHRSWASAAVAGPLAGALMTLGAFIAWERRAASPMVPLGLLRERRFASANAVFLLLYLSLAGMFFFVTLYYQNPRGWSALKTGLSWLILNTPFLVTAASVGRLAARYARRALICAGCLVAAFGMFCLALLQRGTGFWLAGIGYAAVGLGYGLAVPLASPQAMSRMPAALSGTGSGMLNSARQIGASVGLAVMGAIGVGLATHAWSSKVPTLPQTVQAQASALDQEVAGAQLSQVASTLGAAVQRPATDSFLAGYHAAMSAGGVALIAASITAFVGLRAGGTPITVRVAVAEAE
jgi:DHA2 family methylenomycin A resistance protein-like MFS transporter